MRLKQCSHLDAIKSTEATFITRSQYLYFTCYIASNPCNNSAYRSFTNGKPEAQLVSGRVSTPTKVCLLNYWLPFLSCVLSPHPSPAQKSYHWCVICLPETLPTTKMAQTNPMPGSMGPWKVSPPLSCGKSHRAGLRCYHREATRVILDHETVTNQ